MKFITTRDNDGKEELFLFPRGIDHDAMAEVLGYIKNQTHGNWHRVYREPISAGFVGEDGECHGRSENARTIRPSERHSPSGSPAGVPLLNLDSHTTRV